MQGAHGALTREEKHHGQVLSTRLAIQRGVPTGVDNTEHGTAQSACGDHIGFCGRRFMPGEESPTVTANFEKYNPLKQR